MPTNVYVDGFNLYYGAVRGTPHKWLDLATLVEKLLPGRTINRIRYFTATPTGRPNDPDIHIRHALYMQALKTIPNLQIHFGQFVDRPQILPQFPFAYREHQDPAHFPPLVVQVMRTEEKRSDVNIATYLLLDCFNKEYDEAVVVSNDSDLSEPIKIVTQQFGEPVVVVNPQRSSKTRWELRQAATSVITINKSILRASQFPPTITVPGGTIHKPASW